jgi:hypothetical protein
MAAAVGVVVVVAVVHPDAEEAVADVVAVVSVGVAVLDAVGAVAFDSRIG